MWDGNLTQAIMIGITIMIICKGYDFLADRFKARGAIRMPRRQR
jgi:hypothetical protein